jgi:hypothetical protein
MTASTLVVTKITHIKLHARILEGLETALEGGELFGIRAMRAKYPAHHHGTHPHSQTDQDKEQYRKVVT